MPSHIFTRVSGYWNESISSNRTAATLAKAGNEPDDRLHASDYLVYAYLQQARDEEARAVIEEMTTVTGFNPDRNTGPFALAASQARYVVERGDWAAAARLTIAPSKFGYAEAMTCFARALGAIRSGQPAAGTADANKLAELRDTLGAANDRDLGGAGRHPVAGRLGVAAVRGRQARSGAQRDAGRCRRRGQD